MIGQPGTRLRFREVVELFGPFLRPHRKAFALSLVLVLAGTAASLLKPWPLKFLFDELLAPAGARRDSGEVQMLLLAVVVALAGIALLDSLLSFARTYLLTRLGEGISTALRSHVYAHLQRLQLAYHERQQTGDLMTRVTSDVDKVQAVVTTTVIETGANALTIVGMLAVMFALDWQLSLVMIHLTPLLVFTVQRFRRRIKAGESLVRRREGELANLAQESLTSVKLVKAYGREQYEAQRFRTAAERNLDAELRVTRVSGVFSVALDLVTAVALAGLVWLGAQRVLSGHLTPGDLVVFTAYLRDFISPARSLSRLPATLAKASVRAEKLADVLREQPMIADSPRSRPAPRLSGHLELRSVSYGYDPSRPVLHDVDLEVRPGQVVAVVGPTGAGKSTLAGLICRLHDPDSGQVLADGTDIRDYTLATYQSQVAVVLQGAVLFHASVRENIAYGRPDADDAMIEAAAQVADAHEFITALPQGYDTVLGERGDTLSGGQRGRIALARAVLRNAPLLVLDEPTTGLDARSERAVLGAIRRVMPDRATVLITHHLALIRDADVVVVINDGRVVQRGTHDQLIAQRGGPYAELARLQGLLPAHGKDPTMTTLRAGDTEAGPPGRSPLRSPTVAPRSGQAAAVHLDLAELAPILSPAYDLGRWLRWEESPEGKSNVTFFVDTDRGGRFVLRRSHPQKTVEAAIFEAGLLDHLVSVGYPAPPVLRTRDGGALVEIDGVVHMAFQLLPGGPCDITRPEHRREAAYGLARFHEAAAGLALRDVPETSYALSALAQTGRPRLAAVLPLGEQRLDRQAALQLRRSADYLSDEIALLDTELAERRPQLSLRLLHASYGTSALLFDGPRLSGVLDYDRVVYDLTALDFAYSLKAFGRDLSGGDARRVGFDPER